MSVALERLVGAGLLPEEARRKGELFSAAEAALAALRGTTRDDPAGRWFVPGRVVLLGRHTAVGGGRSLVAAVGRGLCVAAAPSPDRVLRVAEAGHGVTAEIPLVGAPAAPVAGAEWLARRVASRLTRDFPGLRGADVAVAGDLPREAGLGGSTALAAALVAVLADFHRLGDRREGRRRLGTVEDLARYVGAIEEDAGDGSEEAAAAVEDAAAIAGSRPGAIAQWAFRPLRHERWLPLEDDWRLVVASSGIAAARLSDFRDRSRRHDESVDAILALWNRSTGCRDASLFSALATSPDAAERLRALLRAVPPPGFDAASLLARLDHFVEESFGLVPAAGDLLARGEVALLGEPVGRSREIAERLLAAALPAAEFLAGSALHLGAVAASTFGGVGESAWALVRTGEADAFRRRWAEGYGREHPAAAAGSRFFTTRPGPSLLAL